MMFAHRSPSNPMFWLYLFCSLFCKFAVPVFFMISGILLFRKEYTIKEWVKKIIKFVIILVIVSTIYYANDIINNGVEFHLSVYVRKMATCGFQTHFWYLYMYILLLLSGPFISKIIKAFDKNLFNYLTIILFLEGLVPCMYYIVFKRQMTFNYMMSPIWYTNIIFIYPLMGYYLHNNFNPKKKYILDLWILNIVSILFSSLMTYYGYKVTGILSDEGSQMFHYSFVFINAICIFITMKKLCENVDFTKHKVLTLISKLGPYVFGIYLFHVIFKRIPLFVILMNYIKLHGFSGILTTFIICLYMFVCSFILTFILSKIPFIKKLVGF